MPEDSGVLALCTALIGRRSVTPEDGAWQALLAERLGPADMKASLAAFVVAAEMFLEERPRHSGSIAFLVTSDEEGPSVDGTARVVERMKSRGETIDYS